MTNEKIRIKDIAERAGVSVGTVDRVLHKRPNVSKKALEKVKKALEKALPKANVVKGYGVRAARLAAVEKELNRFLIENKYKDGVVEKRPDYSAQQPVTDEERAIFDAACSSYQFPLGTPETVGKRTTSDSTDYKFTVKGRGMNGEEATSIIYVTVEKTEGAKPEFTEVVR